MAPFPFLLWFFLLSSLSISLPSFSFLSLPFSTQFLLLSVSQSVSQSFCLFAVCLSPVCLPSFLPSFCRSIHLSFYPSFFFPSFLHFQFYIFPSMFFLLSSKIIIMISSISEQRFLPNSQEKVHLTKVQQGLINFFHEVSFSCNISQLC